MKKFIAWLSLALIAVCIVPFGAFQVSAAAPTNYELITNRMLNYTFGIQLENTTYVDTSVTPYINSSDNEIELMRAENIDNFSYRLYTANSTIYWRTYYNGIIDSTIAREYWYANGKWTDAATDIRSLTWVDNIKISYINTNISWNNWYYAKIGLNEEYSITYNCTNCQEAWTAPKVIEENQRIQISFITPEDSKYEYVPGGMGANFTVTNATLVSKSISYSTSNGTPSITLVIENPTGNVIINAQFARNQSYTTGYDIGYSEGLNMSNGEPWKALFAAPVEVVVNTITSMLDFEVFGMNISKAFWVLFTIALITTVFVVFIKWKL